MPPSAPVTPCVDSSIAYDNFTKGIESIFNMFFVCVKFGHTYPPFSSELAVLL